MDAPTYRSGTVFCEAVLYALTASSAGMFFKVDRPGTVDFKGTKVDCKSHSPFV